ncbi:MAG: flagellar protein FlaG [Firmicutes bacterium ADurb.Bin419]|nr:MAG: flagellar protein FlaG [Firmicutes bacterium ADurb.Bin419]
MKIESMDATSLQSVKTQNIEHYNDSVNTDINPKIENGDQNNTKYNKNVLATNSPGYGNKELSISDKAVVEAIEKANKAITGAKTQFEFSIHEKTNEIMVKVIDSETQEVIREIPPEKILDMVAKMWEMAGILVDERR